MSAVARRYSIRALAIAIHGRQRQRAPNGTIVVIAGNGATAESHARQHTAKASPA